MENCGTQVSFPAAAVSIKLTRIEINRILVALRIYVVSRSNADLGADEYFWDAVLDRPLPHGRCLPVRHHQRQARVHLAGCHGVDYSLQGRTAPRRQDADHQRRGPRPVPDIRAEVARRELYERSAAVGSVKRLGEGVPRACYRKDPAPRGYELASGGCDGRRGGGGGGSGWGCCRGGLGSCL